MIRRCFHYFLLATLFVTVASLVGSGILASVTLFTTLPQVANVARLCVKLGLISLFTFLLLAFAELWLALWEGSRSL
jgi:hypothetical protein